MQSYRKPGHMESLISAAIEKNPRPTPRPLSLTIVGWWLIAGAVVSVYGLLIALVNPLVVALWAEMGVSPTAGLVVSLISAGVQAASGYAILHRKAWGRVLYLVFGVISVIASAIIFDIHGAFLYFGLISYGIFAYILLRDAANANFDGTYEESPDGSRHRKELAELRRTQRAESAIRQIFAILFAAGAGFLLGILIFIIGFAPAGAAAITSIILGVLIAIALGLGATLWSWDRWAGICGWTFARTGGWAAFCGVSMLVVLHSPYWDMAMADAGAEFELDPHHFIIISVLGLIAGAIGAGLIYFQHQQDYAAIGISR